MDSVEFHASPEGQARTRGRHNVLGAHGVQTLHFTPSELRRDPGGLLATIERAYLARPRNFTSVRALPGRETAE